MSIADELADALDAFAPPRPLGIAEPQEAPPSEATLTAAFVRVFCLGRSRAHLLATLYRAGGEGAALLDLAAWFATKPGAIAERVERIRGRVGPDAIVIRRGKCTLTAAGARACRAAVARAAKRQANRAELPRGVAEAV